MLKLPKGLKKKKKGKKSKHKEKELFTEEELERYRREHRDERDGDAPPPAVDDDEWSRFKHLTTGVDSVLKKTQGDLDRIKSTSFFQRAPPPRPAAAPARAPAAASAPHYTVADFAPRESPREDERADDSDDDSADDGDDADDLFDTSYVDAVERGEVKLAYVPDSPDDPADDGLFDTSHVDALIRGRESRAAPGKKALDIGVAVEVLTGRIDNVTVTAKRSARRFVPCDLPSEVAGDRNEVARPVASEPTEEPSLLDQDTDLPPVSPIDLGVSLHTSLARRLAPDVDLAAPDREDELDEFALLAAESLVANSEATVIDRETVDAKPVLEESWSAFEANRNRSVFAESIIEDQLDVDPYLGEADPFDTSFAAAVALEEDDDFDPRADEIVLNNRRKSTVRIHLTDPAGLRESITSDDVPARDLLGGSVSDLARLADSPLRPTDVADPDVDPFDTTLVDNIVAPGKVELKLLERELIDANRPSGIVDSDPDFDPRADEVPKEQDRRASRPENLIVNKSVLFKVDGDDGADSDVKTKSIKPLTPYYTREVSITEDSDEAERCGGVPRTRSDEDLTEPTSHRAKRRHSEYPKNTSFDFKTNELFEGGVVGLSTKVLTPSGPDAIPEEFERDPFDTSFATNIAPCRTELRLLAKEFSCEDETDTRAPPDLLDPSDDFFQPKALTPEPTAGGTGADDRDPFDTSFAADLGPGKTELKLLESELLH